MSLTDGLAGRPALPGTEEVALEGLQVNGPEARSSLDGSVAPAATPALGNQRVAASNPVPAATARAGQVITELPKYKDTAVLALAASVRLPSGRTFKECVELPPSHEKWPTPVHLYYESNGYWLVETHLSEVQVVFEETTATFSVRNFAPVNEGCAPP